MQPAQEGLEQARAAYEEHTRVCRLCALRGTPCQASKLLRRIYNNLLRTADGRAVAPGRE